MLNGFLEGIRRLILGDKIMLFPVLTEKLLLSAELQLRTYYLKLGWIPKPNHFTPVYIKPVDVPNYLFEHSQFYPP